MNIDLTNAVIKALKNRLGETLVPDYYDSAEDLERSVYSLASKFLNVEGAVTVMTHLDYIQYEAENDMLYFDYTPSSFEVRDGWSR